MDIMEDNLQNKNSGSKNLYKIPKSKNRLAYYNCAFCHFETIKSNTIVNHMEKDHHGKKINCNFCEKDYETSELFLDHVKSVHKKYKEKQGSYPCGECGKIFFERSRLESHQGTVHHIEVSVCEFCSNEFKNKDYLRNHINKVHINHDNAFCDVCSKAFKNKSLLYHHNRAVHEESEDLMCYICGKRLMNEYKLRRHLKKCQIRAKKKTDTYFVECNRRTLCCEKCNKTFLSLKGLEIHKKKAHTTAYCQVCQTEFKNMKEYKLKKHLKRCQIVLRKKPPKTFFVGVQETSNEYNEENLHCEECNKTFLSIKAFESHNKAAHSYDPVSCQVCQKGQKEFKNIVLFRQHLERVHNILDPNDILALIKEVKPDFEGFNGKKKNIKNDSYLSPDSSSIYLSEDLNFININELANGKNVEDPSNLTEYQLKRKELVKQWREKEKEQNKKNEAEKGQAVQHSQPINVFHGLQSITQESDHYYNSDIWKADDDEALNNGDESIEDDNVDLIPKCEVKLEASDESDHEFVEENLFWKELKNSKQRGSEVPNCYKCGKSFARIKTLTDHIKAVHTYEPSPCPFCEDKVLKNQIILAQHLKRFHKYFKLPMEKPDDRSGEDTIKMNKQKEADEESNDANNDMEDRSNIKKEDDKHNFEDESELGGSEVHECDKCDKIFSQSENLTDHVKAMHTYDPCSCPLCEDKLFKNQTYLGKHLKRFHEEVITDNEINKIIKEIKTEVDFKEEIPHHFAKDNDKDKTNTVGYICELCDCDSFELCDCNCKLCDSKATKSVDNEVKYQCELCDYSTIVKSNLRLHVMSIHEGVKYQCELCDYKATTNGNLRLHVQSIHEGIKYYCELCDYNSTRKGTLQKHVKSVHEQYNGELDESKEGVSEVHNCDQCGKSFSQMKKLNAHIKFAHTYEPHPCPICKDKILKNKTVLAQHLKRFHSENTDNKIEKEDAVKSEEELQGVDLLCQLCGERFDTKDEMKSHVKTVHSAKGRQCPYCPNIYKNLSSHIQGVHNKQECVCPQCGKTFTSKNLLRGHITNVHPSDEQRRVCPVCAKEFKCDFSLKQHLKRSIECCQTEVGTCVKCQECDKEFANKYSLKGHIRTVHPSDEERRVCTFCSKEFKSAFSLQQHQRRSGECGQVDISDYVRCPECDKEFANKVLLYHHHIHVHVIENVTCPICGGTYRNRRVLGKHIKNSHDGMVKNPYSKGIGQEPLPTTPEVESVVQPLQSLIPPLLSAGPPVWHTPHNPFSYSEPSMVGYSAVSGQSGST